MKKILIVMLSLAILFAFAACDNKTPEPTEEQKTAAVEGLGQYISQIRKENIADVIEAGMGNVLKLMADTDASAIISNVIQGGDIDAVALKENIRNLYDKISGNDSAFYSLLSGDVPADGVSGEAEYHYAITDIAFTDGFDFDKFFNGLTEKNTGNPVEDPIEWDKTVYEFDYGIVIKATVECKDVKDLSIFNSSSYSYSGTFDVTLNARIVNSNPHGDIYIRIEDAVISTAKDKPIKITNDAVTDTIAIDDVKIALNWFIDRGFPEDEKDGEDPVYIEFADLTEGNLLSSLRFKPVSGDLTFTNGVTVPVTDLLGSWKPSWT